MTVRWRVRKKEGRTKGVKDGDIVIEDVRQRWMKRREMMDASAREKEERKQIRSHKVNITINKILRNDRVMF